MFLYFIFILINIVSLALADNQSGSFLYKDFDPKDKNEYEQVLELLKRDQFVLLDPNENADNALRTYCKALSGNPDQGYQGLRLKLLIQRQENKVLGFVAYHPQTKEGKNKPLLIRAIVIDQKHRRKGLAQYLLSELEEEALKDKKNLTCLTVYSNNEAMLQLLQKRKFNIQQSLNSVILHDSNSGNIVMADVFLQCKDLSVRAS